MYLRELLVEGYKEVEAKFVASGADQALVKKTMQQFRDLVNRNQVQGNERNIDWWGKNSSYEEFTKFLQQKSLDTSKSQLKKSKDAGRSVNLMETDQWLVVIPLDKDASCFHGKQSDWCTTKRTQSHYESYFYDKEIILIYCLNKQTGGMWAIANYRHIEMPEEDEDSEYDLEVLEQNGWAELFDQKDKSLTMAEFQQQTGLDPKQLLDLSDRQMEKGGAVKDRLTTRNDQLRKTKTTLHRGVKQRDLDLERELIELGDENTAYDYASKLGESGMDLGELPLKLQYLACMKNSRDPIIKWIAKPDPKIVDIALENQPFTIHTLIDRGEATPKILDAIPLTRYNSALIEKLMEKGLFSRTLENKLARTFHGMYALHGAGVEVSPSAVQDAVLTRTQYTKDIIISDIAYAMKTFKFVPDDEFFDRAGEVNGSDGETVKTGVVSEIKKIRQRDIADIGTIEYNILNKTDTIKTYQTRINEYQAAVEELTAKPQLNFYDKQKLDRINSDLQLYNSYLIDFKRSLDDNEGRLEKLRAGIKNWEEVITQLSS